MQCPLPAVLHDKAKRTQQGNLLEDPPPAYPVVRNIWKAPFYIRRDCTICRKSSNHISQTLKMPGAKRVYIILAGGSHNTPPESGVLLYIPHICQFWYTATLFRSVKRTPQSA